MSHSGSQYLQGWGHWEANEFSFFLLSSFLQGGQRDTDHEGQRSEAESVRTKESDRALKAKQAKQTNKQ